MKKLPTRVHFWRFLASGARVRSEKGWHHVIILKPGKFNVDVDFNHPLAGRVLHYEIEVQLVREATSEEIQHGHVHGPGGEDH